MRGKYGLLAVCILLTAVMAGACGGEPTVKATYELVLSGEVEEAGVIACAGLEMNVYPDLRSNPCGSCSWQPVSVYAGATAAEVTAALAQAVTRAGDVWQVEVVEDTRLLLVEKEIGVAQKPDAPQAPAGLTIEGTYTPAH